MPKSNDSQVDFPGEALTRQAGAPTQPPGTRWYTDCGNSAGTAHLYVEAKGDILAAHCGRQILFADRQGERQALRYCQRCLKRAQGG